MFLNNVKELGNIIFTIKNGECLDKNGVVYILNESNEKVLDCEFRVLKNNITGDMIVTLISIDVLPTGNYKVDLNKLFKSANKIKTDYIEFNFINENEPIATSKSRTLSVDVENISTIEADVMDGIAATPEVQEQPVIYNSLKNVSLTEFTVKDTVSLNTNTNSSTTKNVLTTDADEDHVECYPIHKVYTSFNNEVVVEFISRVATYDPTKFIINNRKGLLNNYTIKWESENSLRFTFESDLVDEFITILLGTHAINQNENIYKFSVQINARQDYFTSYIITALEYHKLTITPDIELIMWYILNRINSETEFEKLELASIDKAINCVITAYNTPFVLGLAKMNNKMSSGSSTLTDAYLSSATIGPLSASWDKKVLSNTTSTAKNPKDFGEENFNECFIFLKLNDLAKGLVSMQSATINEDLVVLNNTKQKIANTMNRYEHTKANRTNIYGKRNRLF